MTPEDKKDGWDEMDVESYRKDKPEKEENKVQFEVEEEAEVPITAETVEPEVEEEEVEEAPVEEEPEKLEELEGINTKGAEKRIRQLVKQRKEREDVITVQNDELTKLRSELLNARNSTQDLEVSSLGSKEVALNERIKLAESAYLQAYDDGEKEKLLESQNILNDAKTDLKFVSARKAQLEGLKQQAELAQTADHKEEQSYAPAQPTQQYDKLAVEWAKGNEWFGQDEVATAVALAIDQQLKNEGYNPSSSDFYEEVDARVRKELPHKFRAPSQIGRAHV